MKMEKATVTPKLQWTTKMESYQVHLMGGEVAITSRMRFGTIYELGYTITHSRARQVADELDAISAALESGATVPWSEADEGVLIHCVDGQVAIDLMIPREELGILPLGSMVGRRISNGRARELASEIRVLLAEIAD